jgi:methylated-DNA-[protein]-cysteine S-methyltransferase
MSESLCLSRLPSPLGELLAVTDDRSRVCALDFADCEARMRRLLRARHASAAELVPRRTPAALVESLGAFFRGELAALDALELRSGGTEFQRSVWAALRAIPSGETTTYSALARALGRPTAFRAVGLANGANPIAIVVPCHRVIGASGDLTGYAGGLARKQWLLDHERRWRQAA